MGGTRGRANSGWPLIAAAFAATAGIAAHAHAQLTGGKVIAGSAAIATSATDTVIHQSSANAIYTWSTFSIPKGSSVNFLEPGASSIALNRVLGGSASLIYGSLSSNGQVWLINRAGIVVGAGAEITTASLLLSTADISNRNFLAGNYKFDIPGNPGAGVSNAGNIHVTGGAAILAGQQVANNGVIAAQLGTVVLAGAKTFTIDFVGDGLLKFAVTAPVDQVAPGTSAVVSNAGTLHASGGMVLMTAQTAKGVLDNVINTSGIVEATSIAKVDGKIVLSAGDGNAVVSGTLDASGKGAGQTGGSVSVTGAGVDLASGAKIDVSGDAGGGSVEISGATLDLAGASFDLSAARGPHGSLLLDPYDLTIDSVLAAAIDGALASGDVTVATSAASATVPSPIAIPAGDVNATGNGDITVAAPLSWASGTMLTLSAYRNIDVDAQIAATGGGSLVLRADNGATGVGTVLFNGGRVAAAGSVSILYDPASYAAPSDFSSDVTAGTLTSYMLVNNATDLQAIASNLSGTYALGAAIDASATKSWNSGAGFEPIGTAAAPFEGTLEGQGNTIANLFINASSVASVGLFGALGANASVQNLALTNASVTARGAPAIDAGILAGANAGTVANVSASGSVTVVGITGSVGLLVGDNAGTIMQSESAGVVLAEGTTQFESELVDGGLVGLNEAAGLIENASSSAIAIGAYEVGGLAGENDGIVTTSWANGGVVGYGFSDYVGGLIGYMPSGAITQSSASGTVLAIGATAGFMTDGSGGGVVGVLGGGSVSGSIAAGNVVGVGEFEDLGGFAGRADGGTVSGAYAVGAVSAATARRDADVGGFAGANAGTVETIYAAGPVASTGPGTTGGFVGSNSGTITQAYAAGQVTAAAGSPAGGFAGASTGGIAASDFASDTTRQPDASGATPLAFAALTASIPANFTAALWTSNGATNLGLPYPDAAVGAAGISGVMAPSIQPGANGPPAPAAGLARTVLSLPLTLPSSLEAALAALVPPIPAAGASPSSSSGTVVTVEKTLEDPPPPFTFPSSGPADPELVIPELVIFEPAPDIATSATMDSP
jgi:filamentous hemagglutinin family protein